MKQTDDNAMERVTRQIAQSAGIGDREADRIACSPFLQARLRAGVEEERRRRAGRSTGGLATLLVAWRAIAVLVIVTVASVVTFWLSKPESAIGAAEPTAPSTDDIARVVTGGACALSTTDECAISTEEVLATLFTENVREEAK